MGQGLEKEQELKIETSRQVTSVCLMLLPAVAVVVGYVLQFRDAGSGFWWIAGGSAVVLAASIFAGGKGISELLKRGSEEFSYFNLQTVLCIAGFLLLVGTYFAIGEPSEDNLAQQLTELEARVVELENKPDTEPVDGAEAKLDTDDKK